MHEALLVQIAHVHAALLGVDLLTVVCEEDRILGVHRDRPELLEEAEVVDLGSTGRLDVDTDPERLQLSDRFIDRRPKAPLVKAQRSEQPGGAGAHDGDVEHGSPLPRGGWTTMIVHDVVRDLDAEIPRRAGNFGIMGKGSARWTGANAGFCI
ncbi:hypothetical protein L2X98_30445 [Microbacterium elymi]|uniref:Uncharacterized protein n=1 Tax=Microbacterium elymi TaxID=2909587 RepID=A0ABY5NHV6_9MICO|nr:hypothetical protein [Microbacterium elymi]UUT34775.1 hypothetical protein L2X98_30445 [Microbacterium elymi]